MTSEEQRVLDVAKLIAAQHQGKHGYNMSLVDDLAEAVNALPKPPYKALLSNVELEKISTRLGTGLTEDLRLAGAITIEALEQRLSEIDWKRWEWQVPEILAEMRRVAKEERGL